MTKSINIKWQEKRQNKQIKNAEVHSRATLTFTCRGVFEVASRFTFIIRIHLSLLTPFFAMQFLHSLFLCANNVLKSIGLNFFYFMVLRKFLQYHRDAGEANSAFALNDEH